MNMPAGRGAAFGAGPGKMSTMKIEREHSFGAMKMSTSLPERCPAAEWRR
jgi:hypothetical protein